MVRLLTASALALLLIVGVIGAARFAEPTKPVLKLLGDGSDETATLQKWIDAGHGGIHFPTGTFRITKPLIIDLDKVGFTSITADGTATLKMDGPGPALRFIGTHEGSAAPASFKPNVWDRQRTPRVEGLEILGGHAEANGIEASGVMQLTMHGVTLRKLHHGVHLVKRNRNVLISACHIYENSGIGIFYDNVNLHQSNIVGCHISYCGGGGVVQRGGEVRNVHIGTCDIEGCQSKDGPPTANIFIDCAGGSTAEVAITGCTIQHSNVPGSANIRIHGLGKPIREGQLPRKWGHVTIGNNVMSDVAVNVDLLNCRGVTMTGNTCWMGYEHNLKAVGCEELVVGSNVFERNPAYEYGTSLKTKNALHFENCKDCTLTGLHLEAVHADDAGLTIVNCQRFNVVGCSILDCEPIGLLLSNTKQSRVSDCLIRHDQSKQAVTMKVVGGADNQVMDNLFSSPPAISDPEKNSAK